MVTFIFGAGWECYGAWRTGYAPRDTYGLAIRAGPWTRPGGAVGNGHDGWRGSLRWVQRGVVLMLVALLPVLLAPPGHAVPGSPGPSPRTGANTQVVMTGTGPGQGVTGGIAPVGSSFDPLAGYPADVPAGFDTLNEGFAGVITARAQGSGDTLSMYCIDIRTSTYPGIGYQNGTWDASNVPNVGYVAQLLNRYYPTTDEPAAAPTVNARAAAVQAAIWFFTDKYVLAAGDPIRDLTAGIVADVIAQGPLVQPPPPNLAITPGTDRGPANALVGPFTVTGDAGQSVTVAATGAAMFADQAGATPIAGNAAVPVGQQIWLQAAGPGAGTATLTATGVATVPTGNVFLYDGNTPGVNDAQRLILAQTGQVTVTAQAAAEFFDTGSLQVSKTIAGPAAGQQGQIVIQVVCNEVALDDFVIPAGATGTQSTTYTGIEAPATCTITETTDGAGSAVTVVTVNGSQTIDLSADTDPADITTADPVTDTYDLAAGSLVVTKTITGTAAGQQGDVVINVSCGNGLNQDITIPAGTTTDTTQTFDGLPAGTECTITETADGATGVTTVSTVGAPDQVSIPAGDAAAVQVTNTYQPAPGSLVVTKTITGTAAGQQGDVVINVSCGNGLNQDITIPAGTTTDTTQTFDGLPAGTECTITETADGVTVGTTVSTVIGADPVTIPAGTRVHVLLINTYSPAPTVTTEPSTPATSSEPVAPTNPTSPTHPPTPGNELPLTGVSPELFMAGLIGALFICVGAILLLAGRRRGAHRPTPPSDT